MKSQNSDGEIWRGRRPSGFPQQLGPDRNFTKTRWAFSIYGSEASGDGGSDAVNRLMKKYAKD